MLATLLLLLLDPLDSSDLCNAQGQGDATRETCWIQHDHRALHDQLRLHGMLFEDDSP